MQKYQIVLGNDVVGNAYTETVGLYTHFVCHCHFPENNVFRIRVCYGVIEIDLGVCIPDGDSYVARRKVATKRLNASTPHFYAYTQARHQADFIPMDPGMNFRYFTKILNATFRVQGEERGVVLNNRSGFDRDND